MKPLFPEYPVTMANKLFDNTKINIYFSSYMKMSQSLSLPKRLSFYG